MTATTATTTTSPWDRFFFTPHTTSPMVLVRVAYGALITLWALTWLPDIDPLLTEGALRYDRSLPAGAWNPLARIGWEQAPLAGCVLLILAGIATTIGYRTRLSSVVAVLLLITMQRANTLVLNSGDLVLRQIGIAVALAPCGLLWSLDGRRARRQGRTVNLLRAPFAMRLLQLELAIGYFLSAWVKVRGNTWHSGAALGLSLRIEDLQRYVLPQWVFEQSVMLNLLTWGSLLFEVAFIFTVWNRRLRPWVLGVGALFHLGIDIVLDIGFFSLAMWTCYLAFVPGSVADRIVGRFDPAALAGDAPTRASAAPVPLAVEPAE